MSVSPNWGHPTKADSSICLMHKQALIVCLNSVAVLSLNVVFNRNASECYKTYTLTSVPWCEHLAWVSSCALQQISSLIHPHFFSLCLSKKSCSFCSFSSHLHASNFVYLAKYSLKKCIHLVSYEYKFALTITHFWGRHQFSWRLHKLLLPFKTSIKLNKNIWNMLW